MSPTINNGGKDDPNIIIRHEPYYKQLEGKTFRTSVLCGDRNEHHNAEPKKIKTCILNQIVNYSCTK